MIFSALYLVEYFTLIVEVKAVDASSCLASIEFVGFLPRNSSAFCIMYYEHSARNSFYQCLSDLSSDVLAFPIFFFLSYCCANLLIRIFLSQGGWVGVNACFSVKTLLGVR